MTNKTTIEVRKETHKELAIMKAKGEFSSFDKLLNDMIGDYNNE